MSVPPPSWWVRAFYQLWDVDNVEQVIPGDHSTFTKATAVQEARVHANRSTQGIHARENAALLTPAPPVLICSHLTLARENDILLAVAVHIRGLPLSFRGKSCCKLTGALVLKNNLLYKMKWKKKEPVGERKTLWGIALPSSLEGEGKCHRPFKQTFIP